MHVRRLKLCYLFNGRATDIIHPSVKFDYGPLSPQTDQSIHQNERERKRKREREENSEESYEFILVPFTYQFRLMSPFFSQTDVTLEYENELNSCLVTVERER